MLLKLFVAQPSVCIMPTKLRQLRAALRGAVLAHAGLSSEQGSALHLQVDLAKGEISLTWPTDKGEEEKVDRLARAALQAVVQRVSTAASKDGLRAEGNQAVPAAAVTDAWQAATNALPQSSVAGMDACYVSLQARMQAQLNQADPARLIALPAGEDGVMRIACRLGFDGTIPQWQQPVELVATNVHDGQEAQHWEPIGHFLGHESRDTLAGLIQGAGWEAETTLAGSVHLHNRDGPVEAVLFVCGDHMALCRLGSADQPGSTLDHRRICPCCEATPTEIHQWKHKWGTPALRLRTATRHNEQFPNIPTIRRVPDVLHGLSNSVKRLGNLVQQFLHEQRRWRKVAKLEEDSIAGELKQYVNFLRQDRWLNWYQPELENLAQAEDTPPAVAAEAAAWMRLWENHTVLGKQLLRKEPVDQVLVEVRVCSSNQPCRRQARRAGMRVVRLGWSAHHGSIYCTATCGSTRGCGDGSAGMATFTHTAGAQTGGWRGGTVS